MKNFNEFVKANKEKLYSLAKSNTKYNENGDAFISRKDSWFYEDEWDKDYERLITREKNSSSGSVIC